MIEEIKGIIAKHFEVDIAKLSRKTNILKDIGADSIDLVMFLMDLEQKYGITIADDDLKKMQTLGDVENYFSSNR